MDLRQLFPELDNPNWFLRLGLIVERHGEGAVRANVRHVRVHSPTGFECGYSGSGPADLALSVLHALFPPPAEDAEEAVYRLEGGAFDNIVGDDACWCDRVGPDQERVTRLACKLHQKFKASFIATMPREGGFIAIEDIRAWVDRERAAESSSTREII
jgi:hypothetical protein